MNFIYQLKISRITLNIIHKMVKSLINRYLYLPKDTYGYNHINIFYYNHYEYYLEH